MYRLQQELIGLRRRHPWLQACRTRVLEKRETVLVYEAVGAVGAGGAASGEDGAASGERLRVTLDLGAQPTARIETASGDELFRFPRP